MPLVTILLVLINASVTRVGQAMDKTAPTSTSVRLTCTPVLRTRTAQITKGVTHAHVIVDGYVSGLSHMGDAPDVIQSISVLAMANVCETESVIASATTMVTTARCAYQTSAAQVTEPVTSMVLVTASMAGQNGQWIVVFAFQQSYAVVTELVTTT